MIRQHELDQRQFLNKSIINYSLCLNTGVSDTIQLLCNNNNNNNHDHSFFHLPLFLSCLFSITSSFLSLPLSLSLRINTI